MNLALPGEVVTYDYRDVRSALPTGLEIYRPLRVLQWNIERGYKLDAVIAILEKLDADILCLQEIDICNRRSGSQNHGQIIAERLKLNAGIAIEFQELRSPCRDALQQGGGLHGNAIYSKFDMSFRVIDHAHQPYNWPRNGMLLGEPRLGHRCTLVAEIQVPGQLPILAYSAHFECFTGILGRTGMLCDLLLDSRRQSTRIPHQLILGDFNTFAHSLARFSPKYANGWYRFRTLGMTEPEWWLHNILSWYPQQDGSRNLRLENDGLPKDLRLSQEMYNAAVNPGWYDPFDPITDITICNHAGWMTAKADWAFVCQLNVIKYWMENRSFSASDHRCLVLEVEHAHEDILDKHMQLTKRLACRLINRRQ
ncbi:hypothetical protein H4R20_003179 [Coemansia guatemalensis]|uniref:Endonuclease/exonuclease/phosphatase domain-containing protein n=1 Tax=Coemansia guatemalensis TaxID=2761395 RepID=A0A9W8I2D4_9FUNG|nr:hypothetical protein H4R20_003179 [Coemansia guatemalensis]